MCVTLQLRNLPEGEEWRASPTVAVNISSVSELPLKSPTEALRTKLSGLAGYAHVNRVADPAPQKLFRIAT